MLILCNIFVELEHFILFNNFDKYHNFIYYRINIKLKEKLPQAFMQIGWMEDDFRNLNSKSLGKFG